MGVNPLESWPQLRPIEVADRRTRRALLHLVELRIPVWTRDSRDTRPQPAPWHRCHITTRWTGTSEVAYLFKLGIRKIAGEFR